MINWKDKLSSRKLWAAVAGWITSLLTAFNVTDNIIARVVIIVSGIGSLCVYILAEGMADKAGAMCVVFEDANEADKSK